MKIYGLFLLVALHFLLGSCQGVDQDLLILPDGTMLSASEKSMLENLKPEVDAVFAEVLGSTRSRALTRGDIVTIADEERVLILQEITAIMQNEIGIGYERYIFTGDYGKREEITAISGEGKAFSLCDGLDAIYQYEMIVDAKWILLPWCTWNWAITEHDTINLATGERKNDNVQQIRAYIIDEMGAVNAQTGPNHIVTATGNIKYGFFPSIPGCKTEHEVWDENIRNGHILRRYSWIR